MSNAHTLIEMSSNASEEIKLPKLDASGKDWTTWKVRLQLAAGSRGLGGYLDGSKKKPIDPAAGNSPGWTATTSEEIQSVEDYEKSLATWTEKDTKVRHMIANTLPNTLFIRLVGKDSAHGYFSTLQGLFEKRSLVVGGAHIDRIIALREELASIGRPVLDDDLFNIVYASLPRSYNPGLAALSSMMRVARRREEEIFRG